MHIFNILNYFYVSISIYKNGIFGQKLYIFLTAINLLLLTPVYKNNHYRNTDLLNSTTWVIKSWSKICFQSQCKDWNTDGSAGHMFPLENFCSSYKAVLTSKKWVGSQNSFILASEHISSAPSGNADLTGETLQFWRQQYLCI